MFTGLKLTRMFRAPTMAEREQVYVSAATDRYDLEARERDVAHGLYRNRRLGF